MTAPREPIAIVGIGCRFPGGVDSPASFWRMLRDGVDAIAEIPEDRPELRDVYDPTPGTPGRIAARVGGFLSGLDQFEPSFFGISPREANAVDPQQRLLLETSWEAFEDAGIVPAALAGHDVGVFIGMWTNEYADRMFAANADVDLYVTTGGGRYAASGRLSFAFDLRGPSLTLDTACSSSLVALHLACQSLRSGECELALAGASNLILTPDISIGYSRSRMLSPDGRCKFGDASANGYVRSEGVGVLLLKPLSRARADGDRIHALVCGSAVNNDGRSSGLLVAPGAGAQQDMLREAYENAGVDPAHVGYVEAHGTGTGVGDPVELEALGAVLGQGRAPDQPCAMGSVKTNIGHAEAASGLAGLIKAALCLEMGQIPPSLHFHDPNPKIPWDRLPLRMQTSLAPWPEGARPAYAGVNSFGVTGTNAHVVLAGAEAKAAPPVPAEMRPDVLTLSAHSAAGLAAQVRRWQEWLREGPGDEPLRDTAYTAARRRTHLEHRLAIVGRDRAAFSDRLDVYARGETGEGISAGVAREGTHRVVFVFPGQGGQWLGMGRQLFDREPAFRGAIERFEQAFRPYVSWSLIAELMAEASASHLDDISVVQPMLFAVEVALAELWRSWGVEPDAVVGHSMGEAAAAFVAGALDADGAARVICRRSDLLRRISGRGAMAVVELSMAEARAALAGVEDRVSVAVSNSARSSVLSGDPEAIDRILAALEEREIFGRRVKVDVASHSPQVDPLLADLTTSLGGLRATSGRVPIFSTVLGGAVDGATLGPAYWARNLREPVRFATAVQALVAEGYDTFIEMGPHPVLVGALQQELSSLGGRAMALPSSRRDSDEQATLLESLGALHASGVAVDWARLYPAGRVVSLPACAWQRERFWYAAPGAIEGRGAPTMPAQRAVLEVVRPGGGPGESESKQEAAAAALFEVVWREAILASPASVARDRPWLVLTDRGGLGRALVARLEQQGVAVESLDWERGLDTAEAWTDLSEARWGGPWSRWAGIAHLWSLDAPDFVSAPGAALGEATDRDSLSVIGLVRALGAVESAAPPRLYLVTAGSQAVVELGDVKSPSSGLLWGLGRVIGAEHPGLRCTNIDVEDGAEAVSLLATELGAQSADNQVAFRAGRRYLPRLLSHAEVKVGTDLRPRWRSVRPAFDSPYRAVARSAGSVEGLVLESMVRRPPSAGQVELEVVASGLNFMNALSVLGACPGYSDGVGPLGGDCAGRVVGVGEGVTGLRPGDAVMGVVLGSLATHALADARLLTPIPAGLDFEQAATVPIAFLTAYYGLHSLARLQPGETVLVHAATGGVGLAALQVARWRGAHVIGSAGSDAKREMLASLGVETILDSRSIDFADALLEATGGRRADVVLNSLAGDFVERGLSVLAPGGRFVELGKRDIQAGRALDLGLLQNGRSFFAVDLDRMIRERPDVVGALLAEVRSLVESEVFRPLPHVAYPASRAREALLTLAEARHVGKLVIRLDDREAPVEQPGLDRERLRQGTCLVTGGLGALGLLTARWLVKAGLRSVVLVGRRAPAGPAAAGIAALEALGASVRVVSADISDRASLERVLETIDREMPPLVGVVHAAGVLEDATLANVTPDQFRRVLAGKAAGALHLHELTANRSLSLFLMYSSIVPLIGSPGQASYAAANAFLDSLAAFRGAQGLAATSINWGPWAGVGLAAEDEQRGARLADRGLPGLEPPTALALLERILAGAPAQAVAAHFDWSRFQQASLDVAGWPFFADVAGAAAPAADSVRDLARRARGGRERVDLIEGEVRGSVARVLRQSLARIDVSKPFRALGLDSLMGLELRAQLERRFDLRLPATLIWNYPNVAALAQELARRAGIPLDDEAAPSGAPEAPLPAVAPDLEAMLAQIEQLSEEDARRLLVEDADSTSR